MGCESCRVVAPKDYESCRVEALQKSGKPYKYVAPCGMDFQRGSNVTPKKKRRKK